MAPTAMETNDPPTEAPTFRYTIAPRDVEWPSSLVGDSPRAQRVFEAIGKAASHQAPVLICGVEGSGKQAVAKSIHSQSPRRNNPLIFVRAREFDGVRLELELFGEEDRVSEAQFESAAEGTLVLHDVDLLPIALQERVERAVRCGAFETLAKSAVHVTCRIIATTSVDLETLVNDGKFSRKLYYLLSPQLIQTPTLRDRIQDLPRLVARYLEEIADADSFSASRPIRVATETFNVLRQYHWPGNLDELRCILQRAVIESNGDVILPEHVASFLSRRPSRTPASSNDEPCSTNWRQFTDDHVGMQTENLYADAVAEMEQQILPRVLQHTSGNQAQAAKTLGMTRASLRKKLRSHGIVVKQVVSEQS